MTDETPRICDYEGSSYRTDFWEGRGRSYEDRVERDVLQRLLPAQGKRLLELGAGFGRLTQEYSQYDHVVLLDYSFSQLQYARQQLGDEGYTFVAADAYQLPFKAGVFDGATMIRVIHHFEDVPAVLGGIRQTLAPDATFILEFANKRNLKALLRYRTGRQDWDPNALNPVEFVELNFNFHPDYIAQQLQAAQFKTQTCIPVSFFRIGALKQGLPAGFLAALDRQAQRSGWLISPSVFTKNLVLGSTTNQVDIAHEDIFASPIDGATLTREGDLMIAPDGTRWAVRDGIYDFKAPLA